MVVLAGKKPIKKKKYPLRRRSSYSSFSSSWSGSDGFDSDSEIEDEEEDKGIDFDYPKEKAKAELPLGELLRMWTNAIDTEGEPLESDGYDSYSSSGSSLADD